MALMQLFRRTACLAALVTAAGTATAAPVVYEDEHILVRAGIVETSNQPIHLGDAVSLVVDVEFDAGSVLLETPNDEWLQRAFAGAAGIRVYESVSIAEETSRGGRVRLASHWRIQALDCPADMLSCAGSKSYELPVMTLSYQLAGASADRIDGRSARFRPWPGRLDVTSAIALAPEPGASLTDILPGGAQPQILRGQAASRAGGWVLAIGVLMLLASTLHNVGQRDSGRAARRAQPVDTRWQRALAAARDAGLSPEQRADVMRRAVTWYCLDELAVNPYGWLGPGAAGAAPGEPAVAAWRELFLDLLSQQGVDEESASAIAARFDTSSGASAPGPSTAASG